MAIDLNSRAFDFMTTAAESTGGHVSEFLREEDKPKKLREYQITEDKRTKIQRAADEFYESGPIGAAAAAVADILPGIPFVDIIDPPATLADPAAQKTRNILGALGTLTSLSKTPQAVGRVATNLRVPFAYGGSAERIKSGLGMIPGGKKAFFKGLHARDPKLFPKSLYEYGLKARAKDAYSFLKRGIRSVIKDEPIYGSLDPRVKKYAGVEHLKGYKKERAILRAKEGAAYTGRLAADNAREFLYRKTFGLKPRAGKNIFKENADGTLSFNPRNREARELIGEIIDPVFDPYGSAVQHSVLGGYSRKLGKTNLKYEDVWDFKMHPGEWSELFKSPTASGVGQAALRTLVNLTTTPPRIKGSVNVPKFKIREREIKETDKALIKAIFGPSGIPKKK